MKVFKRILLGLLIILAILVIGFVIWAVNPLQPTADALAALESDSKVTVTQGSDYVTFMPTGTTPTKAFVFYPGGRVDYRAYAAPLHKLAEQGYLAILLPVRLNLAFFDINAADRAIPDFPEIQDWVVGGHSLGGVAASMYAAKHDNLDGVVYWASYPADEALKNSKMKFTSIYGTLDMGGMESFQSSASLLPSDTKFVVIEGGNHSQFGNYGLQPGDNIATISWQEQQAQVVDATAQLLESLGNK
ncbi:MAG: alpha/beta hydrolase [Syntrophothermus sp.]